MAENMNAKIQEIDFRLTRIDYGRGIDFKLIVRINGRQLGVSQATFIESDFEPIFDQVMKMLTEKIKTTIRNGNWRD